MDADTFKVKAAEQVHLAIRGQRAMVVAHAWIELERYQALRGLIDSRLAVLDPLLVQLERVSNSGVGDVTQVASAQRIVSSILVAEAEVLGKLQQAKTTFLNGFGHLPVKAKYDSSWMSNLVPTSTAKKLAESSPGLLAEYWAYRAAEASVVAIEAKDDFNVGFKVRLQRPFGGSDANSDESVGLALTKDFYRGDQLKSQVDRAKAVAEAGADKVSATYQRGELTISSAREMIKTMDIAITLARGNGVRSREEIDYLRKQLIIGGSTLESVLSAEARLYDAESKEISFIAERRKSEVTIMALTGALSKALTSD